ncbi:hypothetical protein CGLO_13919 [Colletotrichum gloeosporioides Cg-14]|uniref:Uncharacterized protein n=1 Tax=Colletotrichum gloeosporioides (strain Cg-14) TaxID=1237896 RepID=T0L614_COLGC|nr:hypothetical protein CGLO_13919 [Colletotrichum gloeosporioides Cg-14]
MSSCTIKRLAQTQFKIRILVYDERSMTAKLH